MAHITITCVKHHESPNDWAEGILDRLQSLYYSFLRNLTAKLDWLGDSPPLK